MTEKTVAATLLRPVITEKGLAAALQAAALGKPAVISHMVVSAAPGQAEPSDPSLPGQGEKIAITDGRVISDTQVNISALLPDTYPSTDICGIGFYLADGTFFASYRQAAPFLIHKAGETLLIGMDFVMNNIPSDSIIVESTGANLVFGDWVPEIRRINGKQLKADIQLVAADVGAASSEHGHSDLVPTARKVNNKPLSSDITLNASDVGAASSGHGHSDLVPATRKVNNKPLSSDITLNASDVGAWPANKVQQGASTWAALIGAVPCVTDGGVIEMPRYIDMHESAADGDFSWRFDAGAKGDNLFSLYSKSTMTLRISGNGDIAATGKVRAGSPGNTWYEATAAGAFDVSAAINLQPNTLTKILSYRVNNPGQWTLDNSLGAYQEANTHDAGKMFHALTSTDGNRYTRIWKIYNSGRLESPSGWAIGDDGNLNGAAWGGYLSNWLSANLAQKNHVHTAAQGNYDLITQGAGQIGSYALLTQKSQVTIPGTQMSGAYLYWSSCDSIQYHGVVGYGTWMCLGYSVNSTNYGRDVTLWVRVA